MMSKTSPELKQTPRFAVDAHGKPTAVTIDMAAYVALLIKANAIDLALWPPGMEKGAEALARIRQIESDCTANHGDSTGKNRLKQRKTSTIAYASYWMSCKRLKNG